MGDAVNQSAGTDANKSMRLHVTRYFNFDFTVKNFRRQSQKKTAQFPMSNKSISSTVSPVGFKKRRHERSVKAIIAVTATKRLKEWGRFSTEFFSEIFGMMLS